MTGYGARQKRWRKLSFEIEVAEIGGGDMGCDKVNGHGRMGSNNDGGDSGVNDVEGVNGVGKDEAVDEVTVTLDPEEHQAYAWVTEKEIEEGKYAIVTAEQKGLMLEAFRSRKTDGIR